MHKSAALCLQKSRIHDDQPAALLPGLISKLLRIQQGPIAPDSVRPVNSTIEGHAAKSTRITSLTLTYVEALLRALFFPRQKWQNPQRVDRQSSPDYRIDLCHRQRAEADTDRNCPYIGFPGCRRADRPGPHCWSRRHLGCHMCEGLGLVVASKFDWHIIPTPLFKCIRISGHKE